MELNKDIDQFDIPLAKRTYLNNPNSTLLKKLLIFSPFLFLIFSFVALRLIRNVELIPLNNLNNLKFQVERNHDARILGHLPYNETPKEKLVLIEPNIEVHIDMRDSLLKMKEEAKKDGIYLVFLSGYRSINLQNDIFYSLNLLEIKKLQKELEFQLLQGILNIVQVSQSILVMLLKERQTLKLTSKILTPLDGS